MQEAIPSRTALRVALRRAAHQLYDAKPLVLEDPIAVPILGPQYLPEVEKTQTKMHKPFSLGLRAFLVARSRYAEDLLARAVTNEVRQYCLLGAGLDTFAHRNPHHELQVFEVDHPATQAWKRELLQGSPVASTERSTYVSVDFEHQLLPEQLQNAGFDMDEPAFFAWLGVVPYLTLEAFRATVEFIAARPPGSGVVMDYGQPREALPFFEQLAHDSLASRVEQAGEPFRLSFRPEEMAKELNSFRDIEDLGGKEINERYFSGRPDALEVKGSAGRIVSAWTKD